MFRVYDKRNYTYAYDNDDCKEYEEVTIYDVK